MFEFIGIVFVIWIALRIISRLLTVATKGGFIDGNKE